MILAFLRTHRWRIGLFLGAVAIILAGIFYWRRGMGKALPGRSQQENVAVPTIINGDLVLPEVATTGAAPASGLGKATATRLGVVSANLVPVVDSQPGGGQKLSGIRILGEMENLGDQEILDFSPVIRFYDADGKVIGQKIGSPSIGWDFFGVASKERTLYDVMVDNPPASDKLEIVLNVSRASDSAVFDELKIASRSVELKTATYQGSTSGGQASESANTGQQVEYYSVSGSVVNTLSDPVSDISVYAWVKDKNNKIYSFGRQDFKNDLLASGDKIDFRMTLLPLKTGESYDSYEVAAWGKRYRLNL